MVLTSTDRAAFPMRPPSGLAVRIREEIARFGRRESVWDNPAHENEGLVLGGRYRVGQQIAEGGTGIICRATDERTDTADRREVALKILHRMFQELPDIAARFIREATILHYIGHPRIVEATTIETSGGGSLFFAMEYLKGIDLADALAKRPGWLPWPRALAVAVEICDALAALHEIGIVHRDLKPENVFLVQDGGQECVKLLDFGIARLMREPSEDQSPHGTPGYMAPEQLYLQEDHRADIFAVGTCLHEMLTGQLPFPSMPLQQITRRSQERAPLLHAKFPMLRIPESISLVVSRALEYDPDKRFQNATEMAEALNAIGGDGGPANV